MLKKELGGKKKKTIIEFYEHNDIDIVHEMLNFWMVSLEPIPVDELMYLLDITGDIMVIQKIAAVFVVHLSEVSSELIQYFKKTTSRQMRKILMNILASNVNASNSLFLIEQYLKYKQYRDIIEPVLLTEQENIILLLGAYIENNELTFNQEELVINLLTEMKSDTYFKNSAELGNFKIADLFYLSRGSKGL